MLRSAAVAACLAIAATAAAACGTQIGDSCQSDFSCGAGNICDLTAREGYCTRTPCRNRGCDDEEAVCVEFYNGESYCMHRCSESGDCRDGYSCLPARGPGDTPAGACEPHATSAEPCVAGTGAAGASYCYAAP